MPSPTSRRLQLSRELELERIVTLEEAEALSTLSIPTIRREHADKLIHLSPRRQGMRLRDALLLKGV
jgi:hypothetical protein